VAKAESQGGYGENKGEDFHNLIWQVTARIINDINLSSNRMSIFYSRCEYKPGSGIVIWGVTLTATVAALKRLGFGKTDAFPALSPDGRFWAWLQCA
jgi:hypothetical protein